uniref:Peptidase n=1 Tax=viral metagenome TaxID=1070528 RepID=A0A6M3KAR0_9ZZZZ
MFLSWLFKWFAGKTAPPINYEIPSPKIRISQGAISLNYDGENTVMVTTLPGKCYKSAVADTNSLDPFVDAGMTVLLQEVSDFNDLIVGDVIVYLPNGDTQSGGIIHRIRDIGHDEHGWFCKCRGDNPYITWDDPYLIRPSWIKSVMVGVLTGG